MCTDLGCNTCMALYKDPTQCRLRMFEDPVRSQAVKGNWRLTCVNSFNNLKKYFPESVLSTFCMAYVFKDEASCRGGECHSVYALLYYTDFSYKPAYKLTKTSDKVTYNKPSSSE